jgi:hypothetical protein
MPGLEPIGVIAGKALAPAPDPVTQGLESHGLFVVGDAIAIRHFSGPYPGHRWLCRASGKLLERVQHGAITEPVRYATTREEVQALYGAIRQQAVALGLEARDARSEIPLNDPQSYAERFWMNGEELLFLFYDHMTDLQVMVRNTDAIAQFQAHPGDQGSGTLAAYHTQNDVLYLAVGRAASGAADHVVLVYSDAHKPEPTIREGMPAAEWIKAFNQSTLTFPSGVAIVQWGRLSGAEVEWQEDPQAPAQSLLAKLGPNVAIPLAPPAHLAPRMVNVPPAWAVRMEPGNYKATYYELDTKEHGGFSCCAISREGAPAFLPVALGNAGGMIYGGLPMERYAMLCVERDALLMRLGPMGVSSAEMATLCQKYGQPVRAGTEVGRAARIVEWDKMIQGDAAFSAQWAVQIGIATYRLQGIEPTKEQIEAIAQHQNQVQSQLEAHHKQHVANKQESKHAARNLIELARTSTVEGLLEACARDAPHVKAEHVFYECQTILKDPGKYGKVERVEEVTEKIARAYYATLSPQDQKQAGKVEGVVKDLIGDVYPKQGAKVPGFGGFLSRLIDKL